MLWCAVRTLHLLKIIHNRRGQGRDGERGRLDLGRDAVFPKGGRGDGADGGHRGPGGQFLKTFLPHQPGEVVDRA